MFDDEWPIISFGRARSLFLRSVLQCVLNVSSGINGGMNQNMGNGLEI